MQSSAGNWYQGVQAVLVLGMTANISIAQYPILPVMENIGQYPIPQCQYRSNPIHCRWRMGGGLNYGEVDIVLFGTVHYLCLPWCYCCSPPPQSATHSHLAFATLPLPILSVVFLKLTASSRPSAPPSGSLKCLRFGHRLTLCTLNIHLLTYKVCRCLLLRATWILCSKLSILTVCSMWNS